MDRRRGSALAARAARALTRGCQAGWLGASEILARLSGRARPYDTLRIELAGEIREGAGLPLWGLARGFGNDLFTTTTLFRWAREDPCLKAVLVCVGPLQGGWAQIQSLRRAMLAVRDAGKRVWVHLTDAGMREYYLATAADTIFLAPAGHLSITGLALEVTFFKGTLDKLGVEAQVTQAGRYKGAGESWTRTQMSPAQREATAVILDDIYEQIVDGLRAGRGKTKAQVRELIDRGLFVAREAQECGLVDALCYEDEIPAMLEDRVGATLVIDADRYRRQRGREVRRRLIAGGAPLVGLVCVSGFLRQGETVSAPDRGAGAV